MVAVVVPAAGGACLGVDGAGPHALGVERHLTGHARRRVARAELVSADAVARDGWVVLCHETTSDRSPAYARR